MMRFLYVLAVIIGFTSTAYAIRCNVCSTVTEADCGDPFNTGNTYAIDCVIPESILNIPGVNVNQTAGCLTLKFEIAGKAHTSRSCYLGNTATSVESCKQIGKLLGPFMQFACDFCTGDLCNT